MKLPFTIYDLRFTICRKSGGSVSPRTAGGTHGVTRPTALNRQSPIVNRKSQSGVALVITLILLSVTLVMALAFLALSGRERGAVTTETDTATARLAADAGRSFAEAQIAANILTSTNPCGFGLLVSTNYINPMGYNPALAPNPTNVNYYDLSGNYLPAMANPSEFLQALANLSYSPRVPVFIPNPTNSSAPLDFRFYLDLNRNGQFDANGFEVGDPEWIGVLERPDQPCGPNNKFVARFAFIALPVGNSLDLNAIHNQALVPVPAFGLPLSPIPQDYYARNQGVGSWEINLAAFLTDLNTNEWDPLTDPYNYQQPLLNSSGNSLWGTVPNSGRGFEDAFVLLTNRYAGSYNTLPNMTTLYGLPGVTAVRDDSIDFFTAGPLMTGTPAPNYPQNGVGKGTPWLGANNTNHFFTPEELFNTNETAAFGLHLQAIGQQWAANPDPTNDYNRYTFYRMLSQLGTDTDPDSGKMNLNYDNLGPTNGVASATNFISWTPLGFFTNAADRMLKNYTAFWSTSYSNSGAGLVAVVNTNFVATFNVTNAFGLTAIPVWVSNQFVYTPAVQRVLQLAANFYDATTNSYYPSVFRPMFTADTNGNLFVTGYTNVASITDSNMLAQPIDASALSGATNVNNLVANVYGVPWIIGAKKGFPNFNKFEMENIFQITRKLQLTRDYTNRNLYTSPPANYTMSQQLTITMTNLFTVEFWNSYRADYTHGPVQIYVKNANTMTLTNDEGLSFPISSSYTNAAAVSGWPGYGYNILPNPSSFIALPPGQPLGQIEVALPGWIYTFNTNNPFAPPSQSYFVTNTLMPHWGLLVTNRLQIVMLETNLADIPPSIRVIDYAQLLGPENSIDLTAAITNLYDTYYNKDNHYRPTAPNGYNDMWDPITDKTGTPMGLANQISVSSQQAPIIPSYWSQWNMVDVTNQIAGFRAFLGFGKLPGLPPTAAAYIAVGQVSPSQQAPYTPTALVACLTDWEVNDPLVHYLATDLAGSNQNADPQNYVMQFTFGALNDCYRPWGGNVQSTNTDPNPYNSTIKDPRVYSSDYWDFPTNKLPTAGWLGRVHRGTPWQTVYLKSSSVQPAVWTNWTGDLNYFDAAAEAPDQDRLLFDSFTTAFNDNASRGTLSVNVGALGGHDLAAWSALFSGIVVPTDMNGDYTNIAPAGVYDQTLPSTNWPPLVQIVQSINNARAYLTNVDGISGVFEHAGSILRASYLSEQSPYLSGLNPTNQISDEMYEWLPQQIMSLVRVGTPRYVIYSYGQALKPAKNGIYLGGGTFFGMVTNYQVASEIATRTVVRIETTRTNTATGAVTVTPPHAVIESFNILPPD
jgi:hypothetical protein